MNINNLILQLLGGSLTGYITNSLAIKMLFKSYGPFGGVIIKTREEFIENISQLVEKDIINENTLTDSLNQSDVRKMINKMVEHFFTESLKVHTKNIIIDQIPEFKNTSNNFIFYFDNNISGYLLKGSQILLSQIKLKQLVSQKQFDYINQQFTIQFFDIIAKSNHLKLKFNSLLSDLSSKDINSLLTSELIDILTENAKSILQETKKNPEYISRYLNTLKGDLSTYLNLDKLSLELIKQIQEKTLKDYYMDEKYLSNLKDDLIETINSRNSQKVISSIYKNITESLAEDKHSINDFINLELKNNLKIIINKKIGRIINIIEPYLLNNQSNIDDIFYKIINNILEEESKKSPWKSAIKKSAYEYYRRNSSTSPTRILINSMGKLNTKSHLNKKIENYLYQQFDDTDLNEIISYLETTIVQQNMLNESKESIKNEDDSGLIDGQSSNVAFINSYLNKYLFEFNEDKLKEITEKNINTIINLDNFNLNSTVNILSNNKELQKYILESLLTNINKEIDKFFYKKINNFFDPEQSNLFYNKLKLSLKDKQGDLQILAKRHLYNNNKFKALNQVISPQVKEEARSYLEKIISNQLKVKLQKKKNYQIKNLLERLSNRENFKEKVSNNLIYQINNNLPILLKDNISAAIKNNLKSVADNDIKNIVEDFVGKELKPITYFGAFLGLCSASLLYLLQINTTLLPSFQLPVSMTVYGFIGYVTNVIAIKMVFRPYDKKKLLGIPLPFTPGVISKEKSRFAQSVAKFIDEELLNHKTVKNTIQNKKKIIKNIFSKSLTAENYQLPRKLLKQNSGKLSDTLFSNLQKNKGDFIKYIIEALENPNLSENNEELIDSLSNSLTKKIEDYIEHSLPLISSTLLNWLKSKKNISSIIPDSSKNNIRLIVEKNIEEKTNSFIKLLSDKHNNKLETVMVEFIDELYEVIKNKSLGELSEENRNILSNVLYNLLEVLIISNSNNIESKINKTIKNNRKLILDKIPKLMLKNKKELKDIIVAQAEKKMGFWSTAGKLVDFDDTLDKFADIFIEEGLVEILNQFLKEKSDYIINELQFDKNEVVLIIRNLFNNQNTKEVLVKNINILIKELSYITLNDLFRLFKIEKPSKLIKIFSKEIKLLKNNLANNISNNKSEVITSINKAVNDILKQYLYNIDINKIIKSIDASIMENTIKLFYKQLNSNDRLSNFICTIVKEIVALNINKNHLINTNHLYKELNNLFEIIINNPKIIANLKKLISEIYIEVIDQIPEIIDQKTADYFIELLIKSILDTMEVGLPELIEKVNIKEITVTEIDNMSSKEIEGLFYSFAGSYFAKLENYGWLGSIVGLLSEIIKKSI